MNTKLYTLIFILTACITGLQAQPSRLSKKEFQQRQQDFITQKAQLSKEEAQQFFPIYFELQEKKGKLNQTAWQKQRKGRNPETTEDEYAQIIEDVVQTRIDTDRLELEYIRKYKKFLSPRKIYLIQKAEMRFHRELLRDMRHPQKK